MPQKRCRPEEIIAKLRQAEVLFGQGSKVPEVSRRSASARSPTTAGARNTAASRSARPSASRSSSARTPACARRSPTSPWTSSSSRRPPGKLLKPLAATQVRRRSL